MDAGLRASLWFESRGKSKKMLLEGLWPFGRGICAMTGEMT